MPVVLSDLQARVRSAGLRKNMLVVMAMIMVGVSACAAEGGGENQCVQMDAPFALLDGFDVNRTITLNHSDALDAVAYSDRSFSLEIHNHGSVPVAFETNFDSAGYVFSRESGDWQEIPNLVEYPPGMRLLAGKGGDSPSVSVVDFNVGDSPSLRGQTVRLVARGNLLEHDESMGRPVLAFCDVKIPEE